MSYTPTDKTKLIGTNYDAFSRIRVSSPHTEFDSKFENSDNPNLYSTQTVGTGSATYLPNESTISLSVGTASGDSVLRESMRYMEYQPGKSLLIMMTGVLGPLKTGVVSRIGYYDTNDGYYWEQSETGLYIVERSSVTGSVVNNPVPQGNWSIDNFDGTGPSGKILNATKAQIFVFDLQWLGVGEVRVMLDIDGELYPAHEFEHSNITPGTYISSASLPCRYELLNVAATASASSMKQICSTVVSEGGYSPSGEIFSVNIGTTAKTVPTLVWTPLISFKPLDTLNSKRVRGYAELINVDILNTSTSNIIYRWVYNPTLTGASFTTVNASSMLTYDVSATATTGGTIKATNYLAGGSNQAGTNKLLSLPDFGLYSNPYVGNQPTFTLMAMASGTSATVFAAITWKEIK